MRDTPQNAEIWARTVQVLGSSKPSCEKHDEHES